MNQETHRAVDGGGGGGDLEVLVARSSGRGRGGGDGRVGVVVRGFASRLGDVAAMAADACGFGGKIEGWRRESMLGFPPSNEKTGRKLVHIFLMYFLLKFFVFTTLVLSILFLPLQILAFRFCSPH